MESDISRDPSPPAPQRQKLTIREIRARIDANDSSRTQDHASYARPSNRTSIDQDAEITPAVSNHPTTSVSRGRPVLDQRDSQRSDATGESEEIVQATPWDTTSPSIDLSRGNASIAGTASIAPPAKKSRMRKLLTLKEPSTAAWEAFVEEQKREQALKGTQGRGLPVKKLPDYVPKVNSKWNGLPDHAQPAKGMPWKSSLDMSRTVYSRQSQNSDESRDSRTGSSSRQSGSRSSASSSNSSKTLRKPPSKRSDTPSGESTRSKRTIVSRSEATEERRRGPAMSTESIEPSPAREPSSIPAHSLFFTAEQEPPEYASRVELTNSLTATSAVSATRMSSLDLLDGQGSVPQGPRTSPAGGSSEQLPAKTNEASPVSAIEDSTPTREEVSATRVEHHRALSSEASLSPSGPLTPDLDTAIGPHNYHNRFRKQFKSVEEIPQWPLPTKPEDVIVGADEVDDLVPEIPARDAINPSSQLLLNTQVDGTSSGDSQEHSPISPIPSSPVVHPLGNATESLRTGASSTATTNRAPAPLVAPAFQPGRVKTRPFDLDTIAESDAGSIRAPSLYLSPHMSAVDVQQEQAVPEGRTSYAASRASSEMSARWQMSSKERLGLGGLVKRHGQRTPWTTAGDNGVIGADGNWSSGSDREQARRKSSLIGRFKR